MVLLLSGSLAAASSCFKTMLGTTILASNSPLGCGIMFIRRAIRREEEPALFEYYHVNDVAVEATIEYWSCCGGDDENAAAGCCKTGKYGQQ